MSNIHDGEVGPIEFLEQCKATDALLTTLHQYDALWDGELLPEIVDAEFHDCRTYPITVPTELVLLAVPAIQERVDRQTANITLLATICTLVERCTNELYSEGFDSVFHDCLTLREFQTLKITLGIILK